MSDKEYIVAFKENDQKAISRFYNDYRNGFFHDIGLRFHNLNAELLAEIFQESVIRLWKNIGTGKLTPETLSSTLAAYLYCIGRNVAMEVFRREGIFLKTDLDEKTMAELASDSVADIWFGRESEQEVAVRKAVYAMGEPCAPLLLLFYWDKLTWEDIALQLHYKDANSAKSQKYKCIQKLKAKFL